MKIGILTLPLHTNYGGILQSYALQTVLERMGHEVKVINIDRKPHSYSIGDIIKQFIKRVVSSILRLKTYPYYNIRKETTMRYNNYLIKSRYTRLFINKYIHNYWVENYTSDIDKGNFDAIVVGSDQIWSHIHAGTIGGVCNAFLPSFTGKSTIRISYAASFGKDDWEYTDKETKVAKNAIKEFKGISVRESTGVKLCKNYLGVEAIRHLDPTLLLNSDDYIKNLKLNIIEKSPGNLLVYILDSSSEKNAIVDYIEKKLSLKRFVVNSKVEDSSMKNKKIEDCIQPPVENWLRGFMDADFIVTDSFHACVFSILFHKPFVAIGNIERGLTRFQSLLSLFQLEKRLVSSIKEIENLNLNETIDYLEVDKFINAERERSFSYLKKHLS